MRFTMLLGLCLLGLPATFAQPAFPNGAAYDAWKATLSVHGGAPLQTAWAPLAVKPAGQQRGGGAIGTCDCWVPPDATYYTINNNNQWNASGFHNADDGSHGPITLPFAFYLYGQFWNTAYININGNVSFGNWYTQFSSTGFPFNNFTMVAPFWADVDLRGPGAGNNIVQYKVTPTALYVNWTNVGYYSMQTDKVNTFQLIITDGTDPVIPNGANVSFCYKDMQWTTGSASSGVNGFGGTPASVGANQGNGVDYIQFGRFDQPGIAYDGPFGANDGVDWLDDQYFTFSTDITTANVPPVISGQSVCDSLILCVGETSVLDVTFLSPEPNQITVASASGPTLSNFTILNNTPGLAATISVEITPTLADIGYHYITFSGTDNGTPILTSSIDIVVEVLSVTPLTPGDTTLCAYDPPLALIDLLPATAPTGGTWTDPNGVPHSGTFQPGQDVDGTYQYAVFQAGVCPVTGDVTVLTHSLDNGLVVQDVLCHGDPSGQAQVQTSGSGGPWSYTWTDQGGTTVRFVASATNDAFTGAAGNYTLVVTQGVNGIGCSDTMTFAIAEPPLVTISPTTSDTTICKQGTAQLGAIAQGGTGAITLQWSNGLPPGGPHSVQPMTTTTYSVHAVDANGCSSDTLEFTITVRPFLQFSLPDTVTSCPKVDINLLPAGVSGGDGAYLYNWGSGPGTQAGITYNLTASQQVCMTLSDGCETPPVTRCTWLDIIPIPPLVLTADTLLGCEPFAVAFTLLDTTGGAQVDWDFGDGVSTPGPPLIGHVYADQGIFDVGVTVTWPNGCEDDSVHTAMITVLPLPVAFFTHDPAQPDVLWPHVRFLEQASANAVTFDWDFAGLGTSQEPDPMFTFPNELGGLYPVTLVVTNVLGCPDTITRVVEIRDVLLVHVPNTFTPDGDGFNEVFGVVGNDIDSKEFELAIFDRWGAEVFRTTDPTEGWNGTLRNAGGAILSTGVYAWRLRVRSSYSKEKRLLMGHVTLLR